VAAFNVAALKYQFGSNVLVATLKYQFGRKVLVATLKYEFGRNVLVAAPNSKYCLFCAFSLLAEN
jgi:16S rRNA A1518/A1519 N6-dimethyltransferase RsmA/KsgA/DIM1 with predicted DNA glycosylase/AP lyase activity